MSASRRKFLKSGALASLCGALYFTTRETTQGVALGQESNQKAQEKESPQPPPTTQTDDVFSYTKATFEPYLNSEFRTRTGIITTTLTLVEIDDCDTKGKKRDTDDGECFVLIFKADRELPKSVTILKIDHDALGRFELFLGNAKKWNDPKEPYYQAVINHMKP